MIKARIKSNIIQDISLRLRMPLMYKSSLIDRLGSY